MWEVSNNFKLSFQRFKTKFGTRKKNTKSVVNPKSNQTCLISVIHTVDYICFFILWYSIWVLQNKTNHMVVAIFVSSITKEPIEINKRVLSLCLCRDLYKKIIQELRFQHIVHLFWRMLASLTCGYINNFSFLM